jgi:hypothetical protein
VIRRELRKLRERDIHNARRREQLTFQAWTEIYTLFAASTEHSAPVLHRELKELCDMAKTHGMQGGYFDGPCAYRIVFARLDMSEAQRTQADKNFYRQADYLQRSSTLADGCPAVEYSKKALAFIINIRPHLPYVIKMAKSVRQHCITMSSCEAELVALCDSAIELLHVVEVVSFLGHEISSAVEVYTDSKAAYDLCHRFTTAANSRHVDRKMFKMRELRGAGRVNLMHIPGETNPADLFTKILSRQTFEKHRKTVLNLAGDTGVEHARRVRMAARDASSSRDGTGAP